MEMYIDIYMILIMAVNYSDFEFLQIFNSSHNNYDRLNTGLKIFFVHFIFSRIYRERHKM